MKVLIDIYIFKTSDDIRIYKALWDTGATETLISSKVITELNLDQTGEVEVSTINGTINSKRFGCGLLLENHSKSINIQPAEFSHRKECDVIIGMDIIQYGLFILDEGKFSFTINQLKQLILIGCTSYFRHHYSDIVSNYEYYESSDSLHIPAIGGKR